MRNLMLAIFSGLAFSACAVAPPMPSEWTPRIHVSNDIKDDLQILDIREDATPDGTLRLAVSGQSLSYFTQRLRYRAIWFDASGVPIDTVVSAWTRLTLEKAHKFDIKLVGPGRRGISYRIEFENDS